MNRKTRGFILATVLMLSIVIFLLLSSLASLVVSNLLFIGNFRNRTASLYAAEAGICQAIYELEMDPAFEGSFNDTLYSTNNRFEVSVVNPDAGEDDIEVTSTGIAGPFKRTIQATVRRSVGSYNVLANEGPIFFDGSVVINGIRSAMYPKHGSGSIHTNSIDDPDYAINCGDDCDVVITGTASAKGTVHDAIDPEHTMEDAGIIPMDEINKTDYTSQVFPVTDTIDVSGVIDQNTRITDNMEVNGLIRLRNNAVLHCLGDVLLNDGVIGEGTIVVEGTLAIKGTTELKTDSPDGLLIYAENDVIFGSRDVGEDGAGDWVPTEIHTLSEFFAQMPANTPIYIIHNLPEEAPRGVGFFRWYDLNKDSTDADFLRWRDGIADNPNAPGLPSNVIHWLNESSVIVEQFEQWYAENYY